MLGEGQLGRSVASGPVPSDLAYWSGVPVPKLASGGPYVIDAVTARSIDGDGSRVRVGVTEVPTRGATPEPPDAYRFAELPYTVRSDDDLSSLSISIELNDEKTAKVHGVEVDATLDDGREIRMVLPVAVAACAADASDAVETCREIHDATFEQLDDDPNEWGVFER